MYYICALFYLQVLKMEFKYPQFLNRDLYLERIKPFVDTQMIKVIVGQRRVGKSYLLYQLMDYIRKLHPNADLLYINKELYEFDAIKTYTDLLEYINATRQNHHAKCYLFIDEIQDVASFEKALRSLFAEDIYDIYCTGSNANMLSGELATFLSGRYIEFKVFGLTYIEFLKFHGLEDSAQSFTSFYLFGGLPYLRNVLLVPEVVSEYLKNIYNTIVLKDVVNRYNVRNVRQLQDLTVYLADSIGHLFSANRISEYLKSQRVDMPPKTILEYLTFLDNAFLVKRIKQIDIRGKRHFQVGEKYYFEDLGIRHAIRPFQPNDIGQVLENVVCHQLLAYGYQVSIGRDNAKEIDFVAERAGERIYVQVAYSVVDPLIREREFGNLLALKDHYPKMVITMDELVGASEQGIQQIPIRQFLLNFK